MSEDTYMSVKRSKIPWYPTIDFTKCDLCEDDPQCLKFCPHGVFKHNKEKKEFIVKNPYNCVVFCRACSKICPTDALNFPHKKDILQLIKHEREKS